MHIETHHINGFRVAEIHSAALVIATAEDGTGLLGNIYYQGYDRVIIHAGNIAPDFFNLRTGMAGEVLQKFSNYRVRLAIVGDFTLYPGNSLRSFITESNQAGHVNFVDSVEKALERLSKP